MKSSATQYHGRPHRCITMKRILVTGSNGFVGGHILRRVKHHGYAVFGCGRGINRHLDVPYLKADLAEGIETDVEFDMIIHAAALSPSPETTFEGYFADNVLGTRNVIDLARRTGVKKIIYLSSVSSFGNVDKILRESSPHNDPGDYGLTKYVAERSIRDSGLDHDVYILPGVVGERCHSSYIFRLAEALRLGRDVHCYNSEGMFNNVLLVSDLCDFMIQRLEDGSRGDVFLLGCAGQMRIRDLVFALADELDSTSKIEFDPEPRGAFVLDIQKAIASGFVPTPLEKIVTIVCSEIRRRIPAP